MRVLFPFEGNVALLTPAPNATVKWEEMEEVELTEVVDGEEVKRTVTRRVPRSRPMTLAEIIAKDVPVGSPYLVVAAATLPTPLSELTADFTGAPVNTGAAADVVLPAA